MEKKEKLYMHINVRMDREVDKQEYLWNYVSSYLGSMGLEYLGTSEYQPLERMPEETKDLLSQSKKEGENDYEIGFNDGWHTCCRENNIENDARILYLRRKENINRFKESLTNQKKVI